jgi:hypothetical protein
MAHDTDVESYLSAGPTLPLAVVRAVLKLVKDDPNPVNPKWLRARRVGTQ